jgi:NAD(P)-dependent dehydrogenase (short-subunit alcohol dehydrogenase family)
MDHFAAVMITGASSGLGTALALACAQPGTTLHLGGRDAARLEQTAIACRARGAVVLTREGDVRDAASMADWIAGCGRLDLVLANAGLSAGTGDGEVETAAQTRAVFGVNLDGVLNTVLPTLEVMAGQAPDAQGCRGRIAVIASIAAFVPAPGAPAYCAAKAAVDAWTVATAHIAARRGIRMHSVCPGYIRTPMTSRNRFPMPGLMDADIAAARVLAGIRAGRRRHVFPVWLGLAARLVGLLPPRVTAALLAPAGGKAKLVE